MNFDSLFVNPKGRTPRAQDIVCRVAGDQFAPVKSRGTVSSRERVTDTYVVGAEQTSSRRHPSVSFTEPHVLYTCPGLYFLSGPPVLIVTAPSC